MKKMLNVVLGLMALLGTAMFAVPTAQATVDAPVALSSGSNAGNVIATYGTAENPLPMTISESERVKTKRGYVNSAVQCGSLYTGTARVCTKGYYFISGLEPDRFISLDLECRDDSDFVNSDPVKNATVTVYGLTSSGQGNGSSVTKPGNIANSACERTLSYANDATIPTVFCYKVVWSGTARTVYGLVNFGYYTYMSDNGLSSPSLTCNG